MPRLRDAWTGVVVNVSDDTAARLAGSRWQAAEDPKPASRKSQKKSDDKSDD